ncbi:PREDICTED: uncharacterized protein LOC105448537 [Wasmannia auropunctata]|uniref:uncharacterized protein LOC105448537 n=1 Tax=Wasmannia auropunctata TaxID=64793 RepID=UPI0005EF5E5E|nr:PREDICTED: uncharacterized protein LOC105448537 [Wasmannia auropunctata]
MFLIVSNNSDILSLTNKELEYIPKVVLLREFPNCISKLWDKLPEHIKADSEFCGPGTHLEQRLARGDRSINPLDAACREHDIAYSRSNELAERHVADNILVAKTRKRITARNSTLGERAADTAVWAVMKAKTKFGMGLKTNKKRSKRILPVAKRGGILPLLPLLGVVGSLVGGAAGVAKAVSDNKATQRQLEELKRHNRVMEGQREQGTILSGGKKGNKRTFSDTETCAPSTKTSLTRFADANSCCNSGGSLSDDGDSSLSGKAKTRKVEEKANAYVTSDLPPYVVHIHLLCNSRNNMPHPVKIFANVGKVRPSPNIIEMKRLGIGKILVECRTAAAANRLASNPDLANYNLKAVIPNYRVLRTGIIRDIPQEFDVEEIKASLSTSQNHKVISVHRLNRKSIINGSVQYVPSRTICVKFARQSLPSHAFLFWSRHEIHPYIPKARICYSCYRMGHVSASCRSQPRCIYCGNSPHGNESTCLLKDNTPCCINCSGEHLPVDARCTGSSNLFAILTTNRFDTLNRSSNEESYASNQQGLYARVAAGTSSRPRQRIPQHFRNPVASNSTSPSPEGTQAQRSAAGRNPSSMPNGRLPSFSGNGVCLQQIYPHTSAMGTQGAGPPPQPPLDRNANNEPGGAGFFEVLLDLFGSCGALGNSNLSALINKILTLIKIISPFLNQVLNLFNSSSPSSQQQTFFQQHPPQASHPWDGESLLNPSSKFCLKNFRIIRKDRSAIGECGICTLVGCDICFEHVDVSSTLHDSIEVQGIKVKNASLVIINVYRHPNKRTPTTVLTALFELANTYNNILFVDDFNAHHSSWGCGKTDAVGRNLADVLDSLNMVITNNRSPTLLTPPGFAVSIIDLAIVSAFLAPFCTFGNSPDTAGSDHFPIAIHLGVDLAQKKRFLYKIRLDKIQRADLLVRLFKESHLLANIEDFDEASTRYSRFIELIKNQVSSVLPDRPISPRSRFVSQFKASPVWWDEECQREIDNRAKAMRAFKQLSTLNNLAKYKKACTSCTKVINKRKRDKWKALCNSFDGKTPTSKLWNLIKSFRNRNLILSNESPCPAQVIDQAIFNLCPDSCLDGNLPSFSQMKLQNANSPIVISFLNKDLSRKELDLAMNSSKRKPKSTSLIMDLYDPFIAHKGTPQGSSLSPSLFNLYLRLIRAQVASEVQILQYADDIVIFATDKEVPPLLPNLWTSQSMDNRSPGQSLLTDAMAAVACTKWGAQPESMLCLYRAIFRGAIEYESLIFRIKGNRKIFLRLERLQYRAIRLSLVYRMSTPINVMLAEAKQHANRAKGLLIDGSLGQVSRILCESSAGNNGFLHGSKSDNSSMVGAGVFSPDLGLSVCDKLPSASFIFSAEAWAILQAINACLDLDIVNAIIFSDSKSVLETLASANGNHGNHIIHQIKNKLCHANSRKFNSTLCCYQPTKAFMEMKRPTEGPNSPLHMEKDPSLKFLTRIYRLRPENTALHLLRIIWSQQP